jgi:hypothetical protein
MTVPSPFASNSDDLARLVGKQADGQHVRVRQVVDGQDQAAVGRDVPDVLLAMPVVLHQGVEQRGQDDLGHSPPAA